MIMIIYVRIGHCDFSPRAQKILATPLTIATAVREM